MAKKEIQIGKNILSQSSKTYLIAEIGINHNGDFRIVKRLADAAFATGWNSIKMQKRNPDIAIPECQKNLLKDTPWGKITYLDYKKKIELSQVDYDSLNTYCLAKPIDWSSSVWDIPSLKFLLKYDVPYIKIPSALNQDRELILEAVKSSKPIILSTGMSTLAEIDTTVEYLESINATYILLHTTSSYPASYCELNLSLIKILSERYNCLVGYSGHEYDLEPSVIAVALGAVIVERHVTLSHEMWGTDQAASLEVHAMDLLAKRINGVPTMLGDGIKRMSIAEEQIRKKQRREL